MKKAVTSMFVWWLILTIIIRDVNFSMTVVLGGLLGFLIPRLTIK